MLYSPCPVKKYICGFCAIVTSSIAFVNFCSVTSMYWPLELSYAYISLESIILYLSVAWTATSWLLVFTLYCAAKSGLSDVSIIWIVILSFASWYCLASVIAVDASSYPKKYIVTFCCTLAICSFDSSDNEYSLCSVKSQGAKSKFINNRFTNINIAIRIATSAVVSKLSFIHFFLIISINLLILHLLFYAFSSL